MKPRVVATLEDLPNVGPATAEDFRRIGITRPSQLVGQDPYQLFEKLIRVSGVPHDPCTCDVFIAAIRFIEGGPRKPWWAFTAERKKKLGGKARSKR